MITDSYQRRLKNYLLWATMDSVGNAGSTRALCADGPDDPDGLSPEEVMFLWETKGVKSLKCTNKSRLYRYAAGKNVRDFYVSNWVKDVEQGFFAAEEFICTGGMDVEEFHHVFKRYPDPWLLNRIWLSDSAQRNIPSCAGDNIAGRTDDVATAASLCHSRDFNSIMQRAVGSVVGFVMTWTKTITECAKSVTQKRIETGKASSKCQRKSIPRSPTKYQ